MGKILPNKKTNGIIEMVGISLTFLILIAGSFFIITSCSSSKNVNCDAYGKSEIIILPYEDTIIMESMHIHLEEENLCCWVPRDTNIYKDTLYLEINYVR